MTLRCSTGRTRRSCLRPSSERCLIVPGDEGPDDHAENEFLQGLPSAVIVQVRSSQRWHQLHAIVHVMVCQGPYRRGFSPGLDLDRILMIFGQSALDRVLASEGGDRVRVAGTEAMLGADSACCDNGTHVCFRPVVEASVFEPQGKSMSLACLMCDMFGAV